ncbi:MAG: V-type ATPase subunit [Candidatus Woesearchaeota archaeon]|nr:V-type ATPase subunit [Candidatus Woesearchaeota archaeon]
MSDTYAATRIHVMQTKLDHDYEKLLKMSDNEIINYLQSSEYREDVDAIPIKDLHDLEVFDAILSHNGARTMKKLTRIASKNFNAVLHDILTHNDAWNLKIIAEALTSNIDVEAALEQYGRYGTVDPHLFADAHSLEELALKAQRFFPLLKKKPGSLTAFTGSLHIPVRSKGPIAKYLIDEQNILMLVRYKRADVDSAKIRNVLQRGGHVNIGILRAAAQAETLPNALTILRTTKYKEVIDAAAKELEHGTLVRFEYKLHKELMNAIRVRTRVAPLGVHVLLHYLAAKDIEHKNLRLLIKGKRLGLTDEFIREHLVV